MCTKARFDFVSFRLCSLRRKASPASMSPALLRYETSNIWSALYVLKHQVFYRKKLPINMEGSCGLKACQESLWLQGCQFGSTDHLGLCETMGGIRKDSIISSTTAAEVPICKVSKWSSGSSLVTLHSSDQMRLLLCETSPRWFIGSMLFMAGCVSQSFKVQSDTRPKAGVLVMLVIAILHWA